MNNAILLLSAGFLAFPIVPVQASDVIQLEGLETCSVAVERGGPFEYPDACWAESTSMRMVTVDVRVTKDRADDEFFLVEIPFGRIRSTGSVIQIFYTVGVMGKAQWFPLGSMKGVVVMPPGLTLPFRNWVEHGLPIDSFVRVVVLVPK